MDDDDQEPWADPAIRPAYEKALGRFLVLFNEVDDRMSALVTLALEDRQQSHLARKAAISAHFAQKALHLELLSGPGAKHDLDAATFNEIRDLAKERNVVAHGHFDQNPFDGSFSLRGRGEVKEFDTEMLHVLSKRCDAVADKLNLAMMHYWMDEISTVEPSPNAI